MSSDSFSTSNNENPCSPIFNNGNNNNNSSSSNTVILDDEIEDATTTTNSTEDLSVLDNSDDNDNNNSNNNIVINSSNHQFTPVHLNIITPSSSFILNRTDDDIRSNLEPSNSDTEEEDNYFAESMRRLSILISKRKGDRRFYNAPQPYHRFVQGSLVDLSAICKRLEF